jgi:hypothetical protein
MAIVVRISLHQSTTVAGCPGSIAKHGLRFNGHLRVFDRVNGNDGNIEQPGWVAIGAKRGDRRGLG